MVAIQHRYKTVIEHYLRSLHEGDTTALIQLFNDDAIVYSPFLGRVEASIFFTQLAKATSQSIISKSDVFMSADNARRAIAYFRYDWRLTDGTTTGFDCVDVFEFSEDEDSDKISSLTIIYDTYPIREAVGDKYAAVRV
jgi:hypothetical protein